jgi:hypothetical protein
MGLHTFNTLVLRNRHPQWVGPVVTTLGWAVTLAVGQLARRLILGEGVLTYHIRYRSFNSVGSRRRTTLQH